MQHPNREEVMHNEETRCVLPAAGTLMLTATRFEEFRPEKLEPSSGRICINSSLLQYNMFTEFDTKNGQSKVICGLHTIFRLKAKRIEGN